MRAFILGGGQGSRTANPDLPKVLTEVAGFSLLNLQLIELLSIPEVTRITLLLGHQAKIVEDHLRKFLKNHPTKKPIDFIVETEPLGSAGMLHQVLSDSDDDISFVALGDVLPRGGIAECFHIWRTSELQNENLIFVHPNSHPYDSDSVERMLDTNLVKSIISSRDKSSSPRLNLSPVGFFFLNSSDVKFWPSTKKIDLVQDVLPSLLLAKREISALDLLRRSVDIGTPNRLTRMQEVLRNVSMTLDWAVFIDRDDTLIIDPTKSPRGSQTITLTDGVIPFLAFLNNVGVPVICVSNQPSIAKGQSTYKEVESQNREIQDLLAREGVYIDKWLYCPHHPEVGFPGEVRELKVTCDCRKPKSGMLLKVASQHNIDLTKSVILGDTFRDVEIKENLALRIHYLPSGSCDILSHHVCLKSFEQAQKEITNFLGGSKGNDNS